jgi:hypothetical protein
MKQTLSIITVIFIALIGLSSCAEDITTPNTPQYKDTFVVVNVHPTISVSRNCFSYSKTIPRYKQFMDSLHRVEAEFNDELHFFEINTMEEYEQLKKSLDFNCMIEEDMQDSINIALPDVDFSKTKIIIGTMPIGSIGYPKPLYKNLFSFNNHRDSLILNNLTLSRERGESLNAYEFNYAIDFVKKETKLNNLVFTRKVVLKW